MHDPAVAIPILASLNIDETLTFYRDQLGFSGERIGDYAIVRRDAMEMHFWLTTDRIHPEHTACYVRGGQVPALFQEFREKRVPQLSGFEVRPWNMKEFTIIDPHGNLLRFGCAPEELTGHPARPPG